MGHCATRILRGWACQTFTLSTEVQTNQLSQTAVTSLPSNRGSGNQVQKGIKEDYLGHPVLFFFFFFFSLTTWRSGEQHVHCVPSVADSGDAP